MLSALRFDTKRLPIYPYIGRWFDVFDRTEALLLRYEKAINED
jgi:hypothetical protein